MTKWILIGSLMLGSLLTACSGPVSNVPQEITVPSTQPDFSDLFAESNQLYDQLKANTPIEVATANASAQTVKMTIPTLFWISCEARVVSNLQQMPGIVRLDPASEQTELLITFNANQTSLEALVGQLQQGGDEVTTWEISE